MFTIEITLVEVVSDLNTTLLSTVVSYSFVVDDTIGEFLSSGAYLITASSTFLTVLSSLITVMSVVEVVFTPVVSSTVTVVVEG